MSEACSETTRVRLASSRHGKWDTIQWITRSVKALTIYACVRERIGSGPLVCFISVHRRQEQWRLVTARQGVRDWHSRSVAHTLTSGHKLPPVKSHVAGVCCADSAFTGTLQRHYAAVGETRQGSDVPQEAIVYLSSIWLQRKYAPGPRNACYSNGGSVC